MHGCPSGVTRSAHHSGSLAPRRHMKRILRVRVGPVTKARDSRGSLQTGTQHLREGCGPRFHQGDEAAPVLDLAS